jgi:hypothetical protein
MKNRKIYLEKGKNPIGFKEFLNIIDDEQKIYIFDIDGIEKDKPNLCTYQRLSPSYDLWVDFGPRNLGDVVDSFMAGATTITIRNRLCPQLTVSSIREISENKVYANIDFESKNLLNIDDLIFFDSDGLVNFNSRNKIEQDFKYSDYLNSLKMKNKVYTYDSNPENLSFWERFGVEDLLVDINKIEEFKNEL